MFLLILRDLSYTSLRGLFYSDEQACAQDYLPRNFICPRVPEQCDSDARCQTMIDGSNGNLASLVANSGSTPDIVD